MYDPRSDNSLAREVFAADQSIQGYIPDIRRNKKEWFRYFDHNNDSKLSKPEILQALIDTLMTIYDNNERECYDENQQKEVPDIDALSDMLDVMWTMMDLKHDDLIHFDQFIAPDGLADTIVGSLPPLPRSSAPPVVRLPAMQYLQMQCGLCGATKSVAYTPTVVATNMVVICSVCRCSNDILLPRVGAVVSQQPYVPPPPAPLPANPIPTTAHVIGRNSSENALSSSTTRSPPVFKHVFVLSPGRCGSQTFATACQHLSNYTAGKYSMFPYLSDLHVV